MRYFHDRQIAATHRYRFRQIQTGMPSTPPADSARIPDIRLNCKQILSIMLPLVCYCNKCIEFDGDKVWVNGFKLISDRIFP